MIMRQYCAGLAVAAIGAGCLAATPVQAAPAIRVLLAMDVQRLEVQADQVMWATDAHDRAQPHRSLLRIELRGATILLNGSPAAGDQVTLRAGDQDLKLWLPRQNGNGNGPSAQSVDEKSAVQIGGSLQIVRRGKGLLVVNQVDLEEYVKGVVPSEVNSAWHPEMLKVQAVAARTYALYQQMLSASRDYDVAASIQDQVYRGRHGLDARVEQAVESTRGLVITHQGARSMRPSRRRLRESRKMRWSYGRKTCLI
ncbi:MAG: SpoIID/LytB domain-containing protein [Nitrospiraceae bacterium]|nr:SpoIID/LytB domain-containing protein [Nitrospiraceae bacterium]